MGLPITRTKCAWIRNLYDTDETNSILEIRLAHGVHFFRRLRHFLAVEAVFLSLRVVIFLILMWVSFRTFCSADTRTKILGMRNVNHCIEMGLE
jgi:hypothetical protein